MTLPQYIVYSRGYGEMVSLDINDRHIHVGMQRGNIWHQVDYTYDTNDLRDAALLDMVLVILRFRFREQFRV